MTTLTSPDNVTRFKNIKDRVDRIFREKLEVEAKKKSVEEQIATLVAELKTLGIEPSELRGKVEELEKQVTEKLAELEDILTQAETATR